MSLPFSFENLNPDISVQDASFLKSLSGYSFSGNQKSIYLYGGKYRTPENKDGYTISDRMFQYDLLNNKILEIKA